MNILRIVHVGLVVVVLSGAASAAEPVRVVPEGFVANPRQPQAAVDETGTVYVVFGAGDAVYCSKSTDRAKTFGNAIKVGSLPKLALGMRRGPRIVVRGDTVVVSAISHESGNLATWRSADAGVTWQDPVSVNDSPSAAREGLQAMAIGPAGEIYCTWLDMRNSGTALFGSASRDGGKTWSANRQIYSSPDGSICECCHPAVAFDAKGTLYVMWRNSIGGFRDLFGAVSRDGGKTFSAAAQMGSGNWKLDGCPMDGGWLASTATGKVTSVWRRNTEIFRTDTARGGEQLLGSGEQPWVAGTSTGAYVVWLSKRNGDLWLAGPKATQPLKLAAGATDPVIVAAISRKGPVVAAWEAGPKGSTSIMAAVVAE